MNLFTPNVESPKVPEPDEERKRKFDLMYNDLGKFTYEEDGFILQFDEGPQKIKWVDIERLVAYKADLMTVDEIRMKIVYDNFHTTITEETPGWYQFVEKTKLIFPAIPRDWDFKITQPPFATSLTTLYERDDRVMPEGTNFYASFSKISKDKIKEVLEQQGWTSHKDGWDSFELVNSWSELILQNYENEPLLSGIVAYHQINIDRLDKIFNSLVCQYIYEFYDGDKNLILEKNVK